MRRGETHYWDLFLFFHLETAKNISMFQNPARAFYFLAWTVLNPQEGNVPKPILSVLFHTLEIISDQTANSSRLCLPISVSHYGRWRTMLNFLHIIFTKKKKKKALNQLTLFFYKLSCLTKVSRCRSFSAESGPSYEI